jgi:hypothetical protein
VSGFPQEDTVTQAATVGLPSTSTPEEFLSRQIPFSQFQRTIDDLQGVIGLPVPLFVRDMNRAAQVSCSPATATTTASFGVAPNM